MSNWRYRHRTRSREVRQFHFWLAVYFVACFAAALVTTLLFGKPLMSWIIAGLLLGAVVVAIVLKRRYVGW